MSSQTIERKDHHLDLCAHAPIETLDPGALFDEVTLIHEALPDLSVEDLDLSCGFPGGKRLRAPLMITAITGGSARAREINLALARCAERWGLAIGVGSQRAMLESPEAADSFQLRGVAPTAPIVGNLGLWQARALGSDGARRLIDAIGADALAVHLNVAQELIQPEGDRDFRDGLKTLGRLARDLGDRLIVKETGCGISPSTAQRLVEAGVKTLDLAGVGGTSWVLVEALRAGGRAAVSRAPEPRGTPVPDTSKARLSQALGATFGSWGIPTAPCVAAVSRHLGDGARIIASGGVRDGLMAAKALALGADCAGLALPLLKSWDAGGEAEVDARIEEIVAGLRLAMLLTGSRTARDLRRAPRILGERFLRWQAGLLAGQGA